MTRILALDGGGTWALIQARALAVLFPGESGHDILSRFDFAFANSGGSLVLGGLLADFTPETIAAHFTDPARRAALYTPTPLLIDAALRLAGAGARYSTPAKAAALDAIFGTAPFVSLSRPGGGHCCAVIVAYDYVRSRAFFFRAAPSPRFPTVGGVTIAGAVHASSTAPVLYYDRPAEIAVDLRYPGVPDTRRTLQLWDGGAAGLNNPVAAAVAEALAGGTAPDSIAALSLGTGTVWQSNNPRHGGDPSQLVPARVRTNPFADLNKRAEAVIGDPPDFATFLAHTMTGGTGPAAAETVPTRVVRMSPLVLGDFDSDGSGGGDWHKPGWNDASRDPDRFTRLQTLELDATQADDVADIDALAAAWLAGAAWNQPVRANFFQGDDGLHAEVGHTRFGAAHTAARRLGLVP